MTVKFRHYTGEPGFSGDFHRVRDFLVDLNRENAVNPGFHWGRWEWVFSLAIYQDQANLGNMGVWEDGGKIVALAAYESEFGRAYLSVYPEYASLKSEMLEYARAHMRKDGKSMVLIGDSDHDMQRLAFAMGYRATQDKENNAVLDISEETTRYTLPEGFRVTSLADEFDLYKFNRVLWRGFNHGDNPPEDDGMIADRRMSLSGPHLQHDRCIAVVAPDGNFVSYCGTWYDPGTESALVEPVATDPQYRKMGCGKAAVLEAVRRCGIAGAKRAFVGSSQQFYYRIGFYPYSNETFWEHK